MMDDLCPRCERRALMGIGRLDERTSEGPVMLVCEACGGSRMIRESA